METRIYTSLLLIDEYETRLITEEEFVSGFVNNKLTRFDESAEFSANELTKEIGLQILKEDEGDEVKEEKEKAYLNLLKKIFNKDGNKVLDVMRGKVPDNFDDVLKEASEAAKKEKSTLKKILVMSKIFFLKYFIKFSATIGKAVSKVVDFLWSLVKKIPFVGKIAEKIESWGKDWKPLKLFGMEFDKARVIRYGIVMIVLGGVLGLIIKYGMKLFDKLRKKGEEKKQIQGESVINTVVVNQPLILYESTEKGLKELAAQGPGVLSGIANFIENVKDESIRTFVKILAAVFATLFFIITLILSGPILRKIVKYYLWVDDLKKKNPDKKMTTWAKVKYIGAKAIVITLKGLCRLTKSELAKVIEDDVLEFNGNDFVLKKVKIPEDLENKVFKQ